ncbi:hypothetical protein AB0M02_37870 [Actinoplanes sp. NPDC051861]|uniref:hypothetical protein n=1 Tax=Actinoplanes sp. NPDC051861 TaxID=3155170 RepID=UPI00343CCDD6
MNKAMRFLALAGASVAAGAMLGTGAAQAAPSVSSPAGSASGNSVQTWDYDDDYVIGPFRGPGQCKKFGIIGKKLGAFDRFHCFWGWKPGHGKGWYLEVKQDYWQWDDFSGVFDNSWPYKVKVISGPYGHYKNKHYKSKDYGDYHDYSDYKSKDYGDYHDYSDYKSKDYGDYKNYGDYVSSTVKTYEDKVKDYSSALVKEYED